MIHKTSAKIIYSNDEATMDFVAKDACCFTGELTQLIPMVHSTISQHLKAISKKLVMI